MGSNTKLTIQLVFVAFATLYDLESWAINQNFTQNGYIIVNDHVTVDVKDKTTVSIRVANNKFNRTMRTFSVWVTYLKDPNPTNIPVVAQAYRFSDNVYKLFAAIKINANTCTLLAKDLFGIAAIKGKSGNFTDCPWKKNVLYHVHDYVPDPSKMPPFIPEGKYRVAFNYYNNGEHISDVSWYGSIVKRKQF